jgi:putative two-component system response regulator
MRVLVVDDSATNVLLLSQMIKSINCTPIAFSDPLKAAEAAKTLDADLALVDFEMPGMDGVELIKALRAMPKHADLPIVMVTTCDQQAVRYAALDAGATDFLTKPIDPVETKSRVRNLLKLRQAQNRLRDRVSWLANEVAQATRQLAEREQEIVYRLARAAEYRDSETGSHIARMARYCLLIAESMGLDADQCRALYLAAPMHDIGKIAVADSILLKPERLTPDERAAMEQHTLHGHRILADSKTPLIRLAAEIAVSHHERWDGTGYPNGLKGDDIPLVGRIAAVADVFDALTSVRPYKPAWTTDDARAYIVEASGTHFDPACVAAFLRHWPKVLEICAMKETDGEPDAMMADPPPATSISSLASIAMTSAPV